ncbi:hypothetical protein CPC08DRAFT_764354 [Agrocybe pediades]|nr:hypothetical protein CPC08DRAFT_764354 [Agrocybe pediades]
MLVNLTIFLALVFDFAVLVTAAKFNNTVYVISNAETPSLQLPGLTPVGLQRVQECLPPIFAPLDVGLVVSCPFDPESGLCSETIATATPIATSLGLNVTTSCGADEETDDDCVSKLLKNFAETSTQSMLIIWDLNGMDDLFENLDVDDDEGDDDDEDDDETPHFDLITAIVKSKVQSVTSQGCPGIDGQAPGTFRRRSFKKRAMKKRTILSRIVGKLV